MNYVRLRICEDNAVEIVARDLDPTTYRVLLDETFTGAIASGADDHGIHLFRNAK